MNSSISHGLVYIAHKKNIFVSQIFQISIVLPAYNEEKKLEDCVLETISRMKKLDIKFEIIIVENGSIDSTFKIAEEISKKYSEVKSFHLDNPSFGGAIKKGYEIANGDVVINLDVDLSTDMNYLSKLIEYSKNYDVVTGSRYLEKNIVKRDFNRYFLSVVFNLIFVRGLLGSKLKDNNCGFRAVKRNVGLKIFQEVQNDRDFGMVEFIVIAQKREYRIKEFPVSWKENSRHISINFIMNFFIPALKLWRRLNF